MLYETFCQPNAEFCAWSSQHFGWLAFAVLSTIFWLKLGKNAPNEAAQQRTGWRMGMVGVTAWAYSEALMLASGQWEMQSGVPLHLCYFLNFLLPIMLLRRSFAVFDFTYPIVMAGCFQALVTPDLANGFPQFFNLKYWLVHIALVQSALYAIVVYGFRPTFAGIFKCLLFFNGYALLAAAANALLGTNFMYLREKPPGTMLDLFGEWPHYIFGGELLALALFFVAWLPFAGWRKSQTINDLRA